jgi:hypothetical protein
VNGSSRVSEPASSSGTASPAGSQVTPAGTGASISASTMTVTAAGIHGRSRSSPGLGGRSGLYQLASVITCAYAFHTCAVTRTRPAT